MQTVIAKIVEKEDLAKAMVDRFLRWQLPKDFEPDCGIKFTPPAEGSPDHFWPVGTNLLTAEQAMAMIKHMLGEDEHFCKKGIENCTLPHCDC